VKGGYMCYRHCAPVSASALNPLSRALWAEMNLSPFLALSAGGTSNIQRGRGLPCISALFLLFSWCQWDPEGSFSVDFTGSPLALSPITSASGPPTATASQP
jgi:hypothetical protein